MYKIIGTCKDLHKKDYLLQAVTIKVECEGQSQKNPTSI